MHEPMTDRPDMVREGILAALSTAGAFCGESGFQPGETGCADCVRVRSMYADAVMPVIDRLRAVSEGRRAAAVASHASEGVLQEQINAQAAELDRLRADLIAARDRIHAVETVKCWVNEDGRRFAFAEDIAFALGYTPTTASQEA